ncbi:hypothetical protein, partial [Gluconobacter cerinus]|uniref:hypothetical protein n=1 Tax=Gluconobacter cerinus TaxID=38307 RepID=UPI001B8C160F
FIFIENGIIPGAIMCNQRKWFDLLHMLTRRFRLLLIPARKIQSLILLDFQVFPEEQEDGRA